MSLSVIWEQLYENAMGEDSTSQINFIKLIGEQVRNIELDVLLKEQALFIPNNDYVSVYGGTGALLNENGFYYNGASIWNNYLVFPIRGADNKAKGIGGFNPVVYLKAKETLDYSLHYYSYSVKSVFNKGDYLFWGPEGFEKALQDGYVILVDGMFDAIQLRKHFHAAALMGSILTETIIAQLRLFKKIIIVSDNDTAGFKLENNLKRYLRNCVYLRQGYDKDVDGAFKIGYEERIISELDCMIHENINIDHVIC